MSKIITITDDSGMFANEPIAVTELTDIFCAGITGAVKNVRERIAGEPEAEVITKELFDCLNHSFSKCLEVAFPEYELHPELTEEAILKAENEIIAARVAQAEHEEL